jgi:hypothetical protein
MIYGTAYIAGLKRRTAELRAQRAAEAAAQIFDPRAKLREQITQWQAALPEVERAEAARQGYFLEDIRKVIHATPQDLGLALAELSWSRRRIWQNNGPYRRHWYPPSQCVTPSKTEVQNLNLVGVPK